MTPHQLRALLEQVKTGSVDLSDAEQQVLSALRNQPFEDLGFAKVDHHRSVRQGFPEVILGLGKTPDQIAKIAQQIVGHGHPLLITRVDQAAWAAVQSRIPGAVYHEL